MIAMPPAEIAEKLKRACECVPFVRSVIFHVIKADGTKEQVSLDALKLMNIAVTDVPNLHKQPAAGSSSHNATETAALRAEHEKATAALREEVKVLKQYIEDLAAKHAAMAATPMTGNKRQRIEDEDDEAA